MEIPKAYDPKEHESRIYKMWEEAGLFNPDNLEPKSKKHFSIVLPPPNVTGTLHLGHAAMLAIEDLMVRYKRMNGFDTLWMPGTDHAAIATQNVVEKKLYKEEKKTRHDLGREKFLKKVEQYVEGSKNVIHNQLRKMGSSLDWSREAYTLDEVRSKAVKKVFKQMYEDGLIYRGYRIVNWCPRCHSTLADDEVDYKEEKAKIYTFKYDKNFPFAIATTRPETKLGDTAVAVHPDDKRYAKYIGKTFVADFCGVKLNIKVIADDQVEKDFGTGALGVTPAHSLIDYEMAQKNKLPVIKVIDEDGKITVAGGKFQGLSAEQAREKIVEELKKQGLLEKQEENQHNLSVCYRCKSVVEPLPSEQWFISISSKFKVKSEKLRKIIGKKEASLKEISLAVVKSGSIKIIPERFEKIYYHWMENLHDWCISRQIWFGHRIPVWYKKQKQIIVLRHGQAESNARDQLNSDILRNHFHLTVEGREQAAAAAEELQKEKIDIIFCSDFERAKQTAKIVADKSGIKQIIEDARLREVGVGDFEGKSDMDFTKFRQQNFDKWHKGNPHNIESFVELRSRVFNFLDEIKQKYGDKKILMVTHGDVARVAQAYGKILSDKEIYGLDYPDTGKFYRVDLNQKTSGIELSFRNRKIFEAIKSGSKTIETRALNPEEPDRYFGNIKGGDQIILNYKQGEYILESLKSKVKAARRYKTIEELLAKEKMSKIFPGKNIDYKKSYSDLVPGNLEKISKNGIIAFELGKVEKYNKNITLRVSEEELPAAEWKQDEDTLDTWFSAGLWTFSTLLPKDWDGKEFKSKDLERFHPTTVLETGYDILFFWVARMILMTTYATGEIPFETVYLHGLIRDKDGDKMSKSKPETAIDPVEAGNKYGFDAVRLSLLIGNTAGNDIRLYDEKIEGYRNFVNKLWNISRFVLQNNKLQDTNYKQITNNKLQTVALTLADKWILSRFNKLKCEVNKLLDEYNFSQAGEILREFTWNDFADWYLEISKVALRQDQGDNRNLILNSIFRELLKLWHPFVPFVTEAVWSLAMLGMTQQAKSIMVSDWPAVEKGLIDEKAEKGFEKIQEIIIKIRNLRAEYKVNPGKKISVSIKGASIGENEIVVKTLARLEKITYVKIKPEKAAGAVVGKREIYLLLSDLVDVDKEKERLEKEKADLEKYCFGLDKKLQNKEFTKNAPVAVVDGERAKLTEAEEKLGKTNTQLSELK